MKGVIVKRAPEQDFLKTSDVASILMVTEGTVRALIRGGEFPNAKRPGRGYLIPRSDVNAYILKEHK